MVKFLKAGFKKAGPYVVKGLVWMYGHPELLEMVLQHAVKAEKASE